MKILAVDIGAGTQDILLYNDRQNIENCVKLVLPSPHRLFAAQVREATREGRDLFVQGDVIGGGAFASALRNHVRKGLRVVMSEWAAYTVRNNLDEVRALGIEVTGSPLNQFSGMRLNIEEVNLTTLGAFLAEFNEPLTELDAVAIAVQDHGIFPAGVSNRRFRIHKMRELLENGPQPENLAYTAEEIPPCFLRMRSAAQAIRRHLPMVEILIMDTSPAALLGCLRDPAVTVSDPILVVNVGNSHTMAALMKKGNIIGLMEHHTRLLDSQELERLLIAFTDGHLSDDEVFNDNGHGLFFLDQPPGFSQLETIAATGPNRALLASTALPVHYAVPGGDVMMTGPMGLVEAATRKLISEA